MGYGHRVWHGRVGENSGSVCGWRAALDYCKENGIEFWAYMVLEQGALSGKYDKSHPLPAESDRGKKYNPVLEQLEALTNEMTAIGKKYGASCSQIGIAWAIAKGTQHLGVPELDTLFSFLNERKAVVILHPHRPEPVNRQVMQQTPLAMQEYLSETTRAVSNMISRNVLARYPNVKVVVPHCGAYLPLMVPTIPTLPRRCSPKASSACSSI